MIVIYILIIELIEMLIKLFKEFGFVLFCILSVDVFVEVDEIFVFGFGKFDFKWVKDIVLGVVVSV